MPEFLEVFLGRALGDFGAERGVAPRAALAGDEVLALRLVGQREEAGGQVPGAVDQRLVDAMVADHGKTEGAEALADARGKFGAVGFEAEDGNLGKVHHGLPNRIRSKCLKINDWHGPNHWCCLRGCYCYVAP